MRLTSSNAGTCFLYLLISLDERSRNIIRIKTSSWINVRIIYIRTVLPTSRYTSFCVCILRFFLSSGASTTCAIASHGSSFCNDFILPPQIISFPAFGSCSFGTLELGAEGTVASSCNLSQISATSKDPGFNLADLLRRVFLGSSSCDDPLYST
jgi:hypothetical protein